MTYYAQTAIETPDGRFNPGDVVKKGDVEGFDDLVEGGAIADSEPAVEITASDAAESGEMSA